MTFAKTTPKSPRLRLTNVLVSYSAGVRRVLREQTAQQPRESSGDREGSAARRLRGDERERRGGKGQLVRAEDTIYGHFVGEKEDRRDDEEHRVATTEEGRVRRSRDVVCADLSATGQRLDDHRLRGAVVERGGAVV